VNKTQDTNAAAAQTAPSIAALTRRVKLSKTGNNNCRCWVRNSELDTEEALGFDRGCGATTRSEFAQGHDAKLKRELQTAYRAGKAVRVNLGEEGILETTPMEVSETRGWEGFMTQATKRASTAGPSKADLLAKLAELEAQLAAQTAE
jgi:hypothetical protein